MIKMEKIWTWLDFIWVSLFITVLIYPLVYGLACFFSYLRGANIYDFSQLRMYEDVYYLTHISALLILFLVVYETRPIIFFTAILWTPLAYMMTFFLEQPFPNGYIRLYFTRQDTYSYYFCHSVALFFILFLTHMVVKSKADIFWLMKIKKYFKK